MGGLTSFVVYQEGSVGFAGEGAGGDADDIVIVVDLARHGCEAQVGDCGQFNVRQCETFIPLVPSSCLKLELYS